MRWANRALILFLVGYLGLVIFANRALYFSKFDTTYWQDRYEHSQWMLPLSNRIIGDDGLYLYEGYRLIHGADPTRYNAEVPPLGKYLIGVSTAVFGNGYIFGLFTTTALVFVTFLLAKRIVQSTSLALLAATLVITDPLITSQFPLTMLDSLQAVFLVLFFWFLTSEQKHNPFVYAGAGLVLGLFSETKFPLLLPIIAVLSVWYLVRIKLTLKPLVPLAAGFVAGYLLPYIPYFASGHSLVDWVRLHKWIINFYLSAKLTPTWGSAVVSLLVGKNQNIVTRAWESISQWSPSWTIMTIASVFALLRSVRTKLSALPLLYLTTVFTIVLYSVIPFWTRYLVILVPMLVILAVAVLSKTPRPVRMIILSTIIISNLWVSASVLFPTPETTFQQVSYNWDHLFFQDVYEDLSTSSQTHISQDAFRSFAMQTFADGQIESARITLQPIHWNQFSPEQSVPVTVTYYTRNLGPFSETHSFTFVNENGRWKMTWDWDNLLTGLTLKRRLKTMVDLAKRGTITGKDSVPLAWDTPSDMIWVTPGALDRSKEAALLTQLGTLFNRIIVSVHIHQRIHGNTVLTIPVPIGVPWRPLTAVQKAILLSYNGVSLTPAYGRMASDSSSSPAGQLKNTQYKECCSYLYTTTTYDGISGEEKAENGIVKGYNGGSLVLTDNTGNTVRTIMQLPKSDGKSVHL